jgi:hypothetical protein
MRHFGAMKQHSSPYQKQIAIDASIVSLQNLPFLSDEATNPNSINKFQSMKQSYRFKIRQFEAMKRLCRL